MSPHHAAVWPPPLYSCPGLLPLLQDSPVSYRPSPQPLSSGPSVLLDMKGRISQKADEAKFQGVLAAWVPLRPTSDWSSNFVFLLWGEDCTPHRLRPPETDSPYSIQAIQVSYLVPRADCYAAA